MAGQETMRRLAAIRKLARQMPLENCDERLAKIAEVASGKGDVEGYFKNVQGNLAERLAAGQASVAPITDPRAAEKEDEKKRKKRGSLDRQERSGRDRGTA
jgi:hypothetical protein